MDTQTNRDLEIKSLLRENLQLKKVIKNIKYFISFFSLLKKKIQNSNSLKRLTVEVAAKKRSPQPSTIPNKIAADSTTNNSSKSNSSSANNSKKSTRREELLKQLKAVEDAIARKRSKLS